MTAHERVFGTRPEGSWTAPGRVNLIGEHTDYNDGFVMPLALPRSTTVTLTRRTDRTLRLHSANAPDSAMAVPAAPNSDVAAPDVAAPEVAAPDVVELRLDDLSPDTAPGVSAGVGGPVPAWAAYPAAVAWALLDAGYEIGGADLHYTSDVPTGAGLSSSAALEVATALALNDTHALGLSRRQLAGLCRRAENDYVGVPCGIMDQMAAACCTAGHVLHLDTRDLTCRQIPFDMAAEGLRLLVVDTRVKHQLGDGAYAERRAACEAGAAALGVPALRDVPYPELTTALARLGDETLRRRVRHVVTENQRVQRVIAELESGGARRIGPLLTAGHASLRDDFAVSCPELDLVVDASVAAGALGARMTGGGFGGSAIVLVEADGATAVGAALTDAFAAAGYRAPRVFDAVPSAGARRLPE